MEEPVSHLHRESSVEAYQGESGERQESKGVCELEHRPRVCQHYLHTWNCFKQSHVFGQRVSNYPMYACAVHSSSSFRGVGSSSIHSSLPAFSRCLRLAPCASCGENFSGATEVIFPPQSLHSSPRPYSPQSVHRCNLVRAIPFPQKSKPLSEVFEVVACEGRLHMRSISIEPSTEAMDFVAAL